MVSTEIREKFKKLYKDKFDIALTDEEATQMSADLINLVKVLVHPQTKPAPVALHSEERGRDEAIAIQSYQQL